MGESARLNRAGDHGAQHTGGNIIRMAFEAGRFIQDAGWFPAQVEQPFGNHHAGGERGGAGTNALAHRDVVIDFEADGPQRLTGARGHGQGGLPDEVVFARGNQVGVAPFDADRELCRRGKTALQPNLQRDTDRVESRPQIGARPGNT